ncbi:hypothetical protein NGF19_25355 [Streptomyces sp. RY43-2]|uniref:Uncharacterized protein n=1 Tax=Streptomyces macrolidinus TaxID=2952607 RepID=A0ABT0ZKE2_9ACTN|nr:hypothetical protein [Streptomyces macrolidinus]MCN9244068.1 hypothetical protein [Streptomyces macrolidinus]
MSLPSRQRYRLLGDRMHAFRLWAYEDLFAEVFAEAIDLLHERQEQHFDPQRLDVQRFVDHTYINLITRPGDLVSLCRRIPEHLRLHVVETYVRHPLARYEVLAAMGGSDEVYRELPSGGWTEIPMYMYGSARLDQEQGRRFDLHDLLPCGAVHDASAAGSLLRAALDGDRLTDQARAAVLAGDGAKLPAPEFQHGQRVHVVVNDRNHTPHRGTVGEKVWHYRDQRWYFFLRDESGRKIRKRYSAADLEVCPVESAGI